MGPATKVLVLTAFSETENILSVAKGGARGYLLKGVDSATLLQAIKTVADAAAREERRRIARELHDRALQVLASMRLRSEACRRHLLTQPAELERELEFIEEAAGNTIAVSCRKKTATTISCSEHWSSG